MEPTDCSRSCASLQGYEISAAAWESTVLPRRVANYDPELLDRLCLAGEVMWGRLSPHPALETEGGRRVRPTRVAPLALFLREDANRLLSPAVESDCRCFRIRRATCCPRWNRAELPSSTN